jgi:lipopolysaccharide/colanic/teichoic acid biosynthesis glycosyltransferase
MWDGTESIERSEPALIEGRIAEIRAPGGWYPLLKAACDRVFAAVLLVVLSPLMILSWIAVKLGSTGPGIYQQQRVGLRGRVFTIYKLRSMYVDSEERTGAVWSNPDHDPRVTPLGWYLRKLHIDELPQLWNVLVGDMSLIGPRPERPEIIPSLEKSVPHYNQRLLVKPGLTGLAQVQLPPDTDIASVRRKLAYDLYYIRDLRFRMDVKVLLGTFVYLAGVPFWVMRRVLRVPGGVHVERAYDRLVEQGSPPRIQPV